MISCIGVVGDEAIAVLTSNSDDDDVGGGGSAPFAAAFSVADGIELCSGGGGGKCGRLSVAVAGAVVPFPTILSSSSALRPAFFAALKFCFSTLQHLLLSSLLLMLLL